MASATITVTSPSTRQYRAEAMDPEAARAWIAALRSGEYHQCRGHLREPRRNGSVQTRDGYAYCAVGAFYAMRMKEPTTDHWYAACGTGQAEMPVSVETLAISLNDRCRLTFPEIADRLEVNLELQPQTAPEVTVIVGPTLVPESQAVLP